MNADIYAVLEEAYLSLKRLKDDFFIIGTSGLILAGIEIEQTHDIDILTTKQDALILKGEWCNRILTNHVTQRNDLFRSEFCRYKFEKMDIEIMGGLEICKNGSWQPLKVLKHLSIPLNDIKIPTIEEQIRILTLFGREKDFEKIKKIHKV